LRCAKLAACEKFHKENFTFTKDFSHFSRITNKSRVFDLESLDIGNHTHSKLFQTSGKD
jgi:hypothetical protein